MANLYIQSTLNMDYLSTVAQTVDCVCSIISNHGLNLPETSPFFVCPNRFDEHPFSNVYITWDVSLCCLGEVDSFYKQKFDRNP